MSNDDALFRFRLWLFALAKEQGSVRAACRLLGVHHSMYYRWLRQLVRFGPEILRPRERRRPRMPNALSPILEQKVLGLALAYPGWGPQRLSSELAREKWGGLKISANGVWRVLRRHGLNTRAKRLGLVAGYAVAQDPTQRRLPELRHIEAKYSGHRVQFDNFYVGRFSGAKRVCWAYIAFDAHTDFAWGELHLTPVNPNARWTSELARRVASDLSARGWRLEAAMTDNASEFKAGQFNQTLTQLGAKHIYIPAGRPQSNGIAERFNLTMLEECWKPAFARYLTPKYTGIRHDTSSASSTTTTSTALTTAATPRDGPRPRPSSRRLGYDRVTPVASPHLGEEDILDAKSPKRAARCIMTPRCGSDVAGSTSRSLRMLKK